MLDELSALLGSGKVSQARSDRLFYSRDLWPRGLLELSDGRPAVRPPRAVVWPESVEDVTALVGWARERSVGLVPYGGGSGVCGGAMPDRGQVVVDMKRMDRILGVEGGGHLVRTQPGVVGWHFERNLNEQGLTLGHFPSSIFCSTVGGWLAARSAGQASTRYGKIEDMVTSLQVVTGTGRVLHTGMACGGAAGPFWTQVFVGSEGTLGIITEATLLVKKMPERAVYRGFQFPTVADGAEAIRRILQRGLRPAVVRLYDEFDTVVALSGSERGSDADRMIRELVGGVGRLGGRILPWVKTQAVRAALSRPELMNRLVDGVLARFSNAGCLLVIGCEGTARLAEAEDRAVREEVERAGGSDLGPGPGEHWRDHRYSVSFKQSPIFVAGGFVDTMEVATTWDRIMDLYEAVKHAVGSMAFVMAHLSHAYAEGCSIYFTFASRAETPEDALDLYDRVWKEALAAVTRVGATISHHHGVGRSKQDFMVEEHGDVMSLYRSLKGVLDPDGVLNPGKMGLGVGPGEVA